MRTGETNPKEPSDSLQLAAFEALRLASSTFSSSLHLTRPVRPGVALALLTLSVEPSIRNGVLSSSNCCLGSWHLYFSTLANVVPTVQSWEPILILPLGTERSCPRLDEQPAPNVL